MAVKMDIEYTGALKTRASHGPSGTTLITAAPVDNQGDGSSFSPTDLLATALGTCAITVMAIAARNHGIDLAGATVQVSKEMSTEAPRRVARLPLLITLPGAVPADLRDRLEQIGRGCPVARSLAPTVEAVMTFVWPVAAAEVAS